jgi:hypothetical protein
MIAENGRPIGLMVKSHDHVTGQHEPLVDRFVFSQLVWPVMDRAIDVNRGVVFTIEKVWACEARLH